MIERIAREVDLESGRVPRAEDEPEADRSRSAQWTSRHPSPRSPPRRTSRASSSSASRGRWTREGPARLSLLALLAQSVEHLHGKEGVDGSSPSASRFLPPTGLRSRGARGRSRDRRSPYRRCTFDRGRRSVPRPGRSTSRSGRSRPLALGGYARRRPDSHPGSSAERRPRPRSVPTPERSRRPECPRHGCARRRTPSAPLPDRFGA